MPTTGRADSAASPSGLVCSGREGRRKRTRKRKRVGQEGATLVRVPSGSSSSESERSSIPTKADSAPSSSAFVCSVRDGKRKKTRKRERGGQEGQRLDSSDRGQRSEMIRDTAIGSSSESEMNMSILTIGTALVRSGQEGKKEREREEGALATTKDIDSSEYSSPIYRPRSLLMRKVLPSGKVMYEQNSDEDVIAAYHRDYHKYQKKLGRLQELPTFKACKYGPNITDWHDLNQKEAVLDVARSVVTVASYDGDNEIHRCTGIIIDWVEVNRSAIVVTSPQIICTETSQDDWEGNNVYASNAKANCSTTSWFEAKECGFYGHIISGAAIPCV